MFVGIPLPASTTQSDSGPLLRFENESSSLSVRIDDSFTTPPRRMTIEFIGVITYHHTCNPELARRRETDVPGFGLFVSSDSPWVTEAEKDFKKLRLNYPADSRPNLVNFKHYILEFDEHGWLEVLARDVVIHSEE